MRVRKNLCESKLLKSLVKMEPNTLKEISLVPLTEFNNLFEMIFYSRENQTQSLKQSFNIQKKLDKRVHE